MKKRIITIAKYLFFLGLGIFLVWWSIKDLNKEQESQIKSALRQANYLLFIPVFFILILSHFIRSLRWRLLIQPLGYKPKVNNTFFAVMIGYLANQAVPRLGEVLKCTVLTRYEKIPADKLIGTIILERIIDVLSLLFVFITTLVIQPDIYSQLMDAFFNSKPGKEEKKVSGYLIAGIVIVVIIVITVIWMLIKKKKPSDIVLLLKKIMRSIIEGVSSVRHLKKRGLFIFYTISIWFLYLAGGYIGFYAIQETQQYGIKESFSILSAGSVGMIATPGGIGAYPFLIEKTMMLYGLQQGFALAFGWLLWLAQTGVILIGGLFSFTAIPYFNKKKINNENT
jgi:glycosyltransferase 2 family protein